MSEPEIHGNTISVPSSLEYLTQVDAFVEDKLRPLRIDDSVMADIAISVSELVNNAILHGNKADASKRVTVTVHHDDGSVSISVTDEGPGFDRNNLPNPVADENLLKEVGRGFFIVESLMDEVAIETTDRGTTVTITKRLR